MPLGAVRFRVDEEAFGTDANGRGAYAAYLSLMGVE
jgi:hypothetical protein